MTFYLYPVCLLQVFTVGDSLADGKARIQLASANLQSEKRMKQPPKTQVPASACADTCIGLRRYLHEATQVSALKPHSFMLAFSGGQGTGLRPDWVARKFNHRSALFRVHNQVTIPEKRINL